MDQLINEVYEIVKDYRSDEGIAAVRMTPSRIQTWINQFDEADRVFMLSELKGILQKRYCSKQEVLIFLKQVIEALVKHYNYPNASEFLMETIFLDLQRQGKSQSIFLGLMDHVLREEFKFEMSRCGSKARKNYVYLDDVLCTGNTLFQDIKSWVNRTDSDGRTYLAKLQTQEIRLSMVYLFIHDSNFYKKKAQFRYQIAPNFDSCYTMFRKFEVPNGMKTTLEVVMPTSDNQPSSVILYQQQVESKVNEYCDEKKINHPNPEFYRPSDKPAIEQFYSSAANRKRFEDILLKGGVRILNASNTNIPNLRALGYSLPSQKNFGFGTLCITWRNVPNNCPIVFWYSGGGFLPLFVKHQT